MVLVPVLSVDVEVSVLVLFVDVEVLVLFPLPVDVEFEELSPGTKTVIPCTLNPFTVTFTPALVIAAATSNFWTGVILPGASRELTVIVVAFESRT